MAIQLALAGKRLLACNTTIAGQGSEGILAKTMTHMCGEGWGQGERDREL